MGYDLYNRSGYMCVHAYDFPTYYKIALEFGWEPMGTVMSDATAEMYAEQLRENSKSFRENVEDIQNRWGGHYLSNDGQTMVVEDCHNFTKALRRAKSQMRELPSGIYPEDLEEVAKFFSRGPVRFY